MSKPEYNKYLTSKRIHGIIFGLLLAIIVQNTEEKLWLPLELEILNNRNATSREIAKQKEPSEKVVLVLFDDKTQFLLRQNGVPIKDFEKRGKNLINEALEILENSGVKAIGINLNLSYPSSDDNDLAKSFAKYKNIVIADSIPSLYYSTSSLTKSAAGIGFGELYADYDKVVHKLTLLDASQKQTPSFSYTLYKVASKSDLKDDIKKRNEFYIRYPRAQFEKISFIDLLNKKTDVKSLKNKVVILGTGLNSKIISDQLHSPTNKNSLLSDSEVQATALSNLFDQSHLFQLGLDNFRFSFILFSALLGFIFSSLPVVKRLIVALLVFVLMVFSAEISYSKFNLILELVPATLVLIGNFIIGSLIYLQLNLYKQNIKLEGSQQNLKEKNIELSTALNELNKHISELREVRKQLAGRSEEERKRIARDLHDDTLARITDLRRTIELTMNSTPTVSDQMKKELESSVSILNTITQEVRRIINALRPSMLDNVLGLIPAIENLLDDLFKRSSGEIQTKLITKITKLRLSETDEIHLYRIIQETLNNVYKHSEATSVQIAIEQQPGQILILIKDNGKGFSHLQTDLKRGFGLIDMSERAELIGAEIQHMNRPDMNGTIVEIMIPMDKIEEILTEDSRNKVSTT